MFDKTKEYLRVNKLILSVKYDSELRWIDDTFYPISMFLNKFNPFLWYKETCYFLNSVMRALKWVPVIWKNHDFDYNYLLVLMQFKLKNMQKAFVEDPYHECSDVLALKIQLMVETLDRLVGDEYYDLHDTILVSRLGTRPTSLDWISRGTREVKIINNKKQAYSIMEFNNEFENPNNYSKEEVAKEITSAYTYVERVKKADLKLLLMLLEDNLFNMWC